MFPADSSYLFGEGSVMFTKWRLHIPLLRPLCKMEHLIDSISELSFDFADNIKHNKKNKQKIKEICFNHLEAVSKLTTKGIKCPDFKPGLEWVNVTEPLSLHNHLKGKIVLLDFFTYCCINCMHMLPELKRLEQEITVEDGLVVVGVHSAKFTNERNTENIEAAVRRYNITHPVVNDDVEALWQALQVHCWPTLYVLGPSGEPILSFSGEDHDGILKSFITQAIDFYKKKGTLTNNQIEQIKAYSFPKSINILSYPGKITINSDGNLAAISDSAHNRVLITDLNGTILHEVGDYSPGLTDGNFENARFFSPQGLAFYDPNTLFVADTENHCIREIKLDKKEVITLIGIGRQGSDYQGGKEGPKQAISSPWDLCFINDILFIAMAGTHQIWAYFFKDTDLWKKSYKAGTCAAVVGSGREENRNNNYPMSAALAQPSGLAFDGKNLYFADSESSTIRAVNIDTGSVFGVVGGTLDPRNLFAFGDKDGTGMDVKLQHPLGVCWSAFDKSLYVADTYNHKIKKIEVLSKNCSTVGDPSKLKLNEPAGLFAFGNKIFVADTNNHRIKVLHIPTYTEENFNLELKKKNDAKGCEAFHSSNVTVHPIDSSIDLEIDLSLSSNYSLTKEAPSKWIINFPGGRVITYDESFSLNPSWNFKVVHAKKNPKITVTGRLFLCYSNKCTVKELLFEIKVVSSETAPKTVKHKISCTL